MIDPDTIKTVILATLTIFTGGGIWTWLQSRHRPTIDRETAATANAKDVSELALAIAEHANQRTESHEARITILENRLSRWMAWGTDIVHRWPIHRQSETAPTLPE